MSDKTTYDKLQEQLQQQNPFKNLDFSIFRSLSILDKLVDESEKDFTKKYFIKYQHQIIPDLELDIIDNIMKINEVRNLVVKLKELEYDYTLELDEQLKDVDNPELEKKMLKIIESHLN